MLNLLDFYREVIAKELAACFALNALIRRVLCRHRQFEAPRDYRNYRRKRDAEDKKKAMD